MGLQAANTHVGRIGLHCGAADTAQHGRDAIGIHWPLGTGFGKETRIKYYSEGDAAAAA
jgi:hypothetical protein